MQVTKLSFAVTSLGGDTHVTQFSLKRNNKVTTKEMFSSLTNKQTKKALFAPFPPILCWMLIYSTVVLTALAAFL